MPWRNKLARAAQRTIGLRVVVVGSPVFGPRVHLARAGNDIGIQVAFLPPSVSSCGCARPREDAQIDGPRCRIREFGNTGLSSGVRHLSADDKDYPRVGNQEVSTWLCWILL